MLCWAWQGCVLSRKPWVRPEGCCDFLLCVAAFALQATIHISSSICHCLYAERNAPGCLCRFTTLFMKLMSVTILKMKPTGSSRAPSQKCSLKACASVPVSWGYCNCALLPCSCVATQAQGILISKGTQIEVLLPPKGPEVEKQCAGRGGGITLQGES